MICVDTNVIAYRFIPGQHTASAEAALWKDADWISSPLWLSEFRNVLAGYLRRELMAFDTALAVASRAEACMRGRTLPPRSAAVLDLVHSCSCSAYDCEFVAVARQHGVALVTTDSELIRAFPDDVIALRSFAGVD